MKLSLSTWQRLTLLQIVGAIEGRAADIRKAGQLLDGLEMTKEENEQVGISPVVTLATQPCPKCGAEVKLEVANGQVTWKDATKRWDIEIADQRLEDFLKQKVMEFGGWRAGQHREVNDLLNQLGIE